MFFRVAILLSLPFGPQADEDRKIADLVRDLGSATFDVREKAVQELKKRGDKAIPALEAALKNADQEIALRARRLIRTIKIRSTLTPVFLKEFPEADDRLAGSDPDAWYEVCYKAIERWQDYDSPITRKDVVPLVSEALARTRSRYGETLLIHHARLDEFQEAIPSLIAYLDHEDSPICQLAVVTLGKLHAREAAPQLIRLLDDKREDVRRASTKALARMGVRSAAPRIIPLLKQTSYIAQLGAESALLDLGSAEILPSLVNLLEDPETKNTGVVAGLIIHIAHGATRTVYLERFLKDPRFEVRDAAVSAIFAHSMYERLPDLRRLLRDKDPRMRGSAASRLASMHIEEAAPEIALLLKDVSGEVRREAVDALWHLDATRHAPDVLALLKDPDPKVRAQAVQALADLGGNEVVPSVVELLADKDAEVFRFAVSTLAVREARETFSTVLEAVLRRPAKDLENLGLWIGRLAMRKHGPDLIKLAGHDREELTSLAVGALIEGRFKEVTPALVRLYRHEDKGVREYAAEGLARVDPDRAWLLLKDGLSHKDPLKRRDSVYFMGQQGLAHAVPRLIELLNDENEHIRQKAAEALGKLDAREAEVAVRGALTDEKVNVRQAALVTLGTIGSEKSIRSLRARLKDKRWWIRLEAERTLAALEAREASEDFLLLLDDPLSQIRWTAADVLGAFGEEKAAPHLRKLLRDRFPTVRLRALRALRRLGSDIEPSVVAELLDDPIRSVRDEAAFWFCEKKDDKSVQYVLEHCRTSGLYYLNAVRRPKAFARLRDAVFPRSLDGTHDEVLRRQAAQAGFRIEMPKGKLLRLRRLMRDRHYSSAGWERSRADVIDSALMSLWMTWILEHDRIRVVPLGEGLTFWQEWWNNKKNDKK